MIFTELQMKHCVLKNRIIRSAMHEGAADDEGGPTRDLLRMYQILARNHVGAIITGAVYPNRAGKTTSDNQLGMDEFEKVSYWESIVQDVREEAEDIRLFMQLAHAGRLTSRAVTGIQPMAPSSIGTDLSGNIPAEMSDDDIEYTIDKFVSAAYRAQLAGFDGIELNAGNGWLIEQFLSPLWNQRTDVYGQNRLLFLSRIIQDLRHKCGNDFAILVKFSVSDIADQGINQTLLKQYVKALEVLEIDAFTISSGSFHIPCSVSRGEIPINQLLQYHFPFSKMGGLKKKIWKMFSSKKWKAQIQPYSENYNLDIVKKIRSFTKLPIILSGGIRKRQDMDHLIKTKWIQGIALGRPLNCEPDFVLRLKAGQQKRSKCVNCNLCSASRDKGGVLQCYSKPKDSERKYLG